jgi:hypothetical protein
MILVAGGQLDPNIGVLLRRMIARGTAFRELLVGPDVRPVFELDLPSARLTLDGAVITPSACFLRHDVFLQQKSGDPWDSAASLNWFNAVHGWALSSATVRIFNRNSHLSENNKIRNLLLAAEAGLAIPETLVTNKIDVAEDEQSQWIQKPVAGGEYTTLVADHVKTRDSRKAEYPRFIQRRLSRPEMRLYRIGPSFVAFRVLSQHLDYRETQQVELEWIEAPSELQAPLTRLTDRLGLTFSASDFMLDQNGNWRFLEINSQPMFARFDRVAEGRITDAIIDWLSAP